MTLGLSKTLVLWIGAVSSGFTTSSLLGCSSDDGSSSSGGASGTGATSGSGGKASDGGCAVNQAGCESCLTSKCANQVTQCDADAQCGPARKTIVSCATACQSTFAQCGLAFVTSGGSVAVDLWSCAKNSCAGATADKCGE